MDQNHFVCVDLGSNMKIRNESDTENEQELEEPQRKAAGFEWAAEPDEMLFPCCATKFVMLGTAAFLTLVAMIGLIMTGWPTGFVWVTISTLFMGLIIFLPEYFSNIINFAVNFCVWVAFTLFCLVAGIMNLSAKRYNGYTYEYKQTLQTAAIFEFIEFFISIMVCILMFRMLYYYYQNRGNENVMAVAA